MTAVAVSSHPTLAQVEAAGQCLHFCRVTGWPRPGAVFESLTFGTGKRSTGRFGLITVLDEHLAVFPLVELLAEFVRLFLRPARNQNLPLPGVVVANERIAGASRYDPIGPCVRSNNETWHGACCTYWERMGLKC